MRPLARAALVLLAAAACGTGRTAVPPPPAPAPPETLPPPPARRSALEDIRLCVLVDGLPREVPAQYDHATGDTLVGGRPFAEAYPTTAEFAEGTRWYQEHELITLDGRRHTKYGRPRVLGPGRAVPLGRTHHGVRLYTEAGDHPPSGILYVPVRPPCEFQSYQWDLVGSGIRG